MASWMDITIAFFLYVGWWLIPLVVLFLYRRSLMKYPIDIVIYEKRGKDVIKTNDRAGRFEDPVHEYRLKLSNDSIPIPDYDWVLQCAYKPTNLFEKMFNLLCGTIGSVTLFKYGSKQYKPILVKMRDGSMKKVFREVKGKDGRPVWMNIYEPINIKSNMGHLDFEVIDWDDINHMIQELRATATRRAPLLAFMEKYGNGILFMAAVMALIVGGYYYKEMIIDAGSKASTLYCNPGTPPADANINKPIDIPLVGDLAA